MGELLITGGRVLDPSQRLDDPAAILIRDETIVAVGAAETVRPQASAAAETLDAQGLTAVPGLIDMHVHFREPGMSEEETIASGARAAAAGGFTAVACMPNTDPALDCEADMNFIRREAKKAAKAWVFPVGAITAGRRGEELSEMGNMVRGGAAAFSDDGCSVAQAGLLRRAMEYARMLGKPILEHCEDPTLAQGHMHESFISTELGLDGIPAEAEEVIVARDVALARLTGARLHIQHVSTRGAIAILRRAKAEGIRVTAEVTPHHLVLTDECVRGYDPRFKVNPPLRDADDVAACVEALVDGTIDIIASDHAPHLNEEKEIEFAAAPCGVIGLETTVGVLLSKLVRPGKLTLGRMLTALTSAPSDVLQLERGRLVPGTVGDVTLLDPQRRWTVDAARFHSKSRNCPFEGWTLTGKAVAAVVGGQVVHDER